MKKYLITYTDTEILSVSEAPTQGTIASGSNMLIDTIDNAILMFSVMAFDVSSLEEIKNQEINNNLPQII